MDPLPGGSQTIEEEPGFTPTTNPALKTSQVNRSLRTYPDFTIARVLS
jgi:hypothetical protein